MEVMAAILSRRSVRSFSAEPVTAEQAATILEAGRWAPSGLNNQPWRFVTVRGEETRAALAQLTKYRRIVAAAPLLIVVFCDREAMYSDLKDHQGIGACLQNMLLAAHGTGLGAVWLGEILNRGPEVNGVLAVPERYELMAVLAVGHPAGSPGTSRRAEPGELLLKEL